MQIDYTLRLPAFEPAFIAQLSEFCPTVFDVSVLDLQWRLSSMPDASVFCAVSAGHLVGFKAGYAMSQLRYYSWLGGVHPSLRRQGVASKLMALQHAWLVERGYCVVETAANQENRPMAQANLKHGFSVCGIRHEPQRVQVLFSKPLR